MVAEKVLFHALLSLWCSCSAIGSDRYCVNVQTFISEWESLNLAASQRFMVPGNKYVHKMKVQLNPNISSPHAVSWPGTAGCVGKQCWGKVPLQGGAPGNSKYWRKKSPPAHREDCSADSRMSRSPDAWPVAVVEAGETKCSVKWEFVYKRVTFLLFCTWFSRELVSGSGFRIVLFQFCSQKGRVSSPSRIVL